MKAIAMVINRSNLKRC